MLSSMLVNTAELKAKWGFEWKPSRTALEEPKCHEAEAQHRVVAHPWWLRVRCAEMSEFTVHLSCYRNNNVMVNYIKFKQKREKKGDMGEN